jgi:hypothetical protein
MSDDCKVISESLESVPGYERLQMVTTVYAGCPAPFARILVKGKDVAVKSIRNCVFNRVRYQNQPPEYALGCERIDWGLLKEEMTDVFNYLVANDEEFRSLMGF